MALNIEDGNNNIKEFRFFADYLFFLLENNEKNTMRSQGFLLNLSTKEHNKIVFPRQLSNFDTKFVFVEGNEEIKFMKKFFNKK